MRILWKQLLIHLGTLIISFALLALVLTQGIRGFMTEQKIGELTSLAQRVATRMQDVAVYGGIFNFQRLEVEIMNVRQYTGSYVMIIDDNYTAIVWTGFGEFSPNLPYASVLSPIMAGEVVAVFGTVETPTFQQLLVVGYPFWMDGQVAGAALVGFYMTDLETAISEMYRMALIALAAAGAFAFVLIYISSQAISRPLRQMNEAASVISGGDFAKRLPIRRSDEVGQLAAQFNRMAESLERQERVRREFIANLSHDMRSPLTSIRGFLTAILDGTIEPAQQPHYLNIIMDESERLIKLSNNILDVDKLQDAEALTLTEFDINDLIRKTILGFKQRAIEKRIVITSHFAGSQDMVLADEEKIRRVMYNLVDNALKFTPEDGEITVETTATRDGKVDISVADTGCGLTEEEQQRVFDRFYKGDASRNMDKLGSGLGLSIVQEFVRAHGEVVTVESELGRGTVFSFSLASA